MFGTPNNETVTCRIIMIIDLRGSHWSRGSDQKYYVFGSSRTADQLSNGIIGLIKLNVRIFYEGVS